MGPERKEELHSPNDTEALVQETTALVLQSRQLVAQMEELLQRTQKLLAEQMALVQGFRNDGKKQPSSRDS